MNCLPDYKKFTSEETQVDTWITDVNEMNVYPERGRYSDGFLQELLYWIQVGKNTTKQICNYNDYLVTQMHIDPPVDLESDTRDDGTLFRKNENNNHPASIDTTSTYNMNHVERNGFYGKGNDDNNNNNVNVLSATN